MDILSIIEKQMIPFKINGNELIIKCIVEDCLDKKGHLYYNLEKNLWNCFRCGNKGNLRGFLYWWNIKYKTNYKWYEFNIAKLKYTFTDKKIINLNNVNKDFVYLHQLTKNNAVKKYLLNRGVDEIKWQLFHLGMFRGVKNMFNLVFPVLEDNNIIGYSIRNIKDKKFKTIGELHSYLYNIDVAKMFPEIFIVEGTFDTIRLVNAVSIFGKTLSKNQVLKLNSKIDKDTDIYLMLDGDTSISERNKEALKLAGLFKNVFIVDLPIKTDPDELDDWQIDVLKTNARRVV